MCLASLTGCVCAFLKIVSTNKKKSPLCHPVVLLLNSSRLLMTAKIFSEPHMAGLAAKP